MTHVMIDIETKGTRTDTTVLAIGAVKFDIHSNTGMAQELYLHPDLEQQRLMQRTEDPATMKWWDTQSEAVRYEAFRMDCRIPLESALDQLSEFCADAGTVWAQGPQFDISILESLYTSLGKRKPWRFNQIRDSRTLFGILGDRRDKNDTGLHNALEDARSQARAAQQAMAYLEEITTAWTEI